MNKLFLTMVVVLLSVQLYAVQPEACYVPVDCNPYPTKLSDVHNTKMICRVDDYSKRLYYYGKKNPVPVTESATVCVAVVSKEAGQATTPDKGKSLLSGTVCGQSYIYASSQESVGDFRLGKLPKCMK